jgi:hypothetical protein
VESKTEAIKEESCTHRAREGQGVKVGPRNKLGGTSAFDVNPRWIEPKLEAHTVSRSGQTSREIIDRRDWSWM